MKAHTPDIRDRCILIALERTGYRSNELASLQTDDVFDFASNTLKPRIQVKREHMKKDQPRDAIALHPDLRAALTLWLSKHKQSGFLPPGVPLWLSRKFVQKSYGHQSLELLEQEHHGRQACVRACGGKLDASLS